MAKKKSTKKAQQAPKAAAPSKAPKKAASTKKAAQAKKNAKPGVFTRIKNYFGSVRTEMRRVVWPTKSELANYTIAVVVSLVVVGVVIALLDQGISQALVAFSSLRG